MRILGAFLPRPAPTNSNQPQQINPPAASVQMVVVSFSQLAIWVGAWSSGVTCGCTIGPRDYPKLVRPMHGLTCVNAFSHLTEGSWFYGSCR